MEIKYQEEIEKNKELSKILKQQTIKYNAHIEELMQKNKELQKRGIIVRNYLNLKSKYKELEKNLKQLQDDYEISEKNLEYARKDRSRYKHLRDQSVDEQVSLEIKLYDQSEKLNQFLSSSPKNIKEPEKTCFRQLSRGISLTCVDELDKGNDFYDKIIEEKKKKIEERNKKIEEANKKIEEANKKIEEGNKIIREKKQEISDLSSVIKSLQDDKTVLLKKQKDLETIISKRNDKIEEYKDSILNYEEIILNIESKHNDKINSLREKIEKLDRENIQLKDEIKEMQEDEIPMDNHQTLNEEFSSLPSSQRSSRKIEGFTIGNFQNFQFEYTEPTPIMVNYKENKSTETTEISSNGICYLHEMELERVKDKLKMYQENSKKLNSLLKVSQQQIDILQLSLNPELLQKEVLKLTLEKN